MNVHVFLLFFNATLTVLVAVAIVLAILRREYRPVIERLEADTPADAEEPR